MNRDWNPESWRQQNEDQQVVYPNEAELRAVIQQLSRLPPLVTSWEVDRLRQELAQAEQGHALLLQGGDCAESFDDCRPDPIANTLKLLLQMSVLLIHRTHLPVVRVGRLGGQYAKPRSAQTEERDGTTLPSYRGDLINRLGFTADERRPDPALMLRGYERAG
jgi:3-deoxy-7-phosphoheptulonate synthase